MAPETPSAGGGARKTRLFLSYSRKDGIFAEGLHQALEAQGYDVLMDRTDIAPGEDWQARLGRLLVESDTMVFCLSPRSVASRICQWEVEEAERLGKRILPVVARSVPDAEAPAALAKLNYIFFEGRPQADALQDLLTALETDLPWLREHTRLGELAQQWQARPGNAGVLRGAALEEAERWIASQPRNAALATDLHRAFIAASRKAAATRQRWWIGGAAAVVALSLGLAGWSEINRREAVRQTAIAEEQRVEAVKQRDRAERTLAAATQTASGMVFGIAQQFKNVKGVPVTVTRTVLDKANGLMQQLTQAEDTKPELKQIYAAGLTEIAGTLLAQGDAAGALERAQNSKSIMLALAAAAPQNIGVLRDLAISTERVGDVLRAQGNSAGALEHYQAEKATFEKLIALEPDAPQWLQSWAASLTSIGDAYKQQGRFDLAAASYGTAFGRIDALAAQHPEDANMLRQVASLADNYGQTVLTLGQVDLAIDTFNTALETRQALSAAEPLNVALQRDVASSHASLSYALRVQGKLPEALQHLEASLAIFESLSRQDPGNAALKASMAGTHQQIGNVLAAQDKLADGLASLETANGLFAALVAQDPANADFVQNLAMLKSDEGGVRLALNDLAQARQAYEAGLALLSPFVARNAGHVAVQELMLVLRGGLGTALYRQDDVQGAVRQFHQGLSASEALAKSFPGQATWQRRIAEFCWKLADVGENPRGNYLRALDTLRQMKAQGTLAKADEGYMAELEKLIAALPK